MTYRDPLMDETIPDLPEDTFLIPQCGIYVKKESSLEPLFRVLRKQGYEIESTQEGNFYASLGETVLSSKGKCRSCLSYIDRRGIRTHNHRCEVCGKPTFIEYRDGGKVRFYFHNDERFGQAIAMKVRGYNQKMKCILLYPDPIESDSFFDAKPDRARAILAGNKEKWRWVRKPIAKGLRKHIRRLKSRGEYKKARQLASQLEQKLIAIKDDLSGSLTDKSPINMAEVKGSKQNYSDVKLFRGKEYSDWDRLPLPEGMMIYKAWEGYPLRPSLTLHETIIHAARMVSRTDYWHQDGSQAFFDIHLLRMRLFVEHLTTLDLKVWDAVVERAPKSGPGFIRFIAAFCQGNRLPEVKEKPNIGNFLEGLVKLGKGDNLNEDEARTFAAAARDEDVMGIVSDMNKLRNRD